MIKKLNEEMGIYIEQELSKLKLRESCLFLTLLIDALI